MAEAYSGVAFPVVFFDGETETAIGDVTVCPETGFRELQFILSSKIGISPHQFSIFLAERRNAHRRRIPISPSTYFGKICQEKDCVFLVVLKRSRRPRRGLKNQRHSSIYFPLTEPPANVTLLRRDDFGGDRSLAGFEEMGRDLLAERERFLMNSGISNLGQERERDGLICEECVRGKEIGRDCGFHRCVFDPVTVGFRSPSGPIARPDNEGV